MLQFGPKKKSVESFETVWWRRTLWAESTPLTQQCVQRQANFRQIPASQRKSDSIFVLFKCDYNVIIRLCSAFLFGMCQGRKLCNPKNSRTGGIESVANKRSSMNSLLPESFLA